MESTALPLARGALDVEPLSPHDGGNWAHVSSALAMSQARDPQQEQALLMRRVSSYQGSYFPHRQSESLLPRQNSRGPTSYGGLAIKRTPRHSYGAGGKLPSQASGSFFPVTSRAVEMEPTESRADRAKRVTLTVMVNLTSGIIAFLLSSTLAVSCASVVVGHGTPLATVIADFIDMNLLGTAVLCVVLAWFSQAPWTLGAMDVFVAPIMSSMADKITSHLDGDLEKVLPTTIVMVSLTSAILGAVFFIMGSFRVTSIANYMPYPVIAGFLSGIGAELMRNGIHMASSKAFTLEFFTIKQQLLIWPAVLFAGLARFGQHLKIPVAISFPCLLIVALLGYQLFMSFAGMDVHDQGAAGWVFSWKAKVVRDTPRWYSWSHIKLKHVDWHALTHECMGFMVSLVILGALKYSVATTSLSTLFGREISPDNEMRVIGLANMASGVLGCCGGCHYLSAMGIMKQFEAHEKVPALVCAVLIVMLWSQGIGMLQYVPKFIFGGLLLSVGLHFIEAYFVAPFSFLKPVEKGIVVLITTSFLVIGMLESVGLGVVISMVELIYRIYEVGCVHHETTGALARSAVDRTPEQTRFLDEEGSAIFVLRLQGYLFFGTSVNILERIETRVRSIEFPKLKFVVIDFGLVPSFDATALLNFRKASVLADRYMFDIYFCGLKPSIELALRQNHYSQRVHLLSSDVDVTLEICENELLPDELKTQATGSIEEWRHLSQLDLWEHFMLMHDTSNEGSGIDTPKLLPLAAHLDIVNLSTGSVLLTTPGTNRDTYFVCFGYINVMSDSEFSNTRNIPGIVAPDSATPSTSPSSSDFMMENEEEESLGASITRRLSFAVPETQSWTPFTTAKSRLLKIGAGSVITPNMSAAGDSAQTYRYIATSDCIVLRLSAAAMQQLEASAPHTAVEVLKMLNKRLASRFRHSNKRVSQLSSLLYK